MSKLFALLFLAAVIAVASAQYLAAYPRAGLVGAPLVGHAAVPAYGGLAYGGLGYAGVPRVGAYYG